MTKTLVSDSNIATRGIFKFKAQDIFYALSQYALLPAFTLLFKDELTTRIWIIAFCSGIFGLYTSRIITKIVDMFSKNK